MQIADRTYYLSEQVGGGRHSENGTKAMVRWNHILSPAG